MCGSGERIITFFKSMAGKLMNNAELCTVCMFMSCLQSMAGIGGAGDRLGLQT